MKKVAKKRTPASRGTKALGSEKVTTVPPTRDVPERVVTKYLPKRCSMFWNDRANKVYREWHATVSGPKLVMVEGVCGEPLTQTTRVYASADAAFEAYEAAELEKTAQWYQRTSSQTKTDFFFVGPRKQNKKSVNAVDSTQPPEEIDGYASDGRMVKDIARLLADAKPLSKKLPAGTAADLKKHAGALPKPTAKALLGLAGACTSGKLRALAWTFTLGFRLAAAFDADELSSVLGGNKKWIALAQHAIEIAHDGGLAHYVACTDGVRVYNNEGSFEAVITPSVDAFMWALVHRTAAEADTYDRKAYAAGLKKLGIKRELALKS